MRLPITLLVAAIVTSFAAVAAADVAPPECAGMKAGDPCTPAAGGHGVCDTATCASPLPDGGASSRWPCLHCFAVNTTIGGSTSNGSNGCSVGGRGPLAGAFAIAIAVPLLVRRRRRK